MIYRGLKNVYWYLLGSIASLAFLIAYVPASQGVYRATQAIPGLSVSGVSGTLWQGNIQRLNVQGIQLVNINWQLSPLALLGLQAKVDIRAGNLRSPQQLYVAGHISLPLFARSKFSMQDLRVLMPANMAMAQLTLPVPVNAQGRFEVALQNFEFDQGCAQLGGTGKWLNGSVSGTQGPISFGDFNAELSCDGRNFSAQIKPPNRLSLDAKVSVNLQGQYQVSGKFKPDPQLPAEVHQAAQFFGQPDAQGMRSINL